MENGPFEDVISIANEMFFFFPIAMLVSWSVTMLNWRRKGTQKANFI